MSSYRRKVVIGLPVYNGEKFLEQALVSLLAQTYQDFELIISDNASTDRTEWICRDYARQDPRIHYRRQKKNLGAIPNFNEVFELSDSRYFKWAASDDLCDPTYLGKAVAILDTNPDVVWCHSRFSHIDPDGRLLDESESLDVSYRERESASPSARFAAVLLDDKGCVDSYGLIRSDAIAKTPLYLPYYGPEKIFVAELALMGRYREIPETLFFARVAPQGSGNLESAAAQQAFTDTSVSRGPRLARVRFLLAYLDAISRSAPNRREAMRCRLAVLRWLFQVSKWRSLVTKALRGQGVGGRNVERIKRLKSCDNSSTTEVAPSGMAGQTAKGETGHEA